MAEQNVSNKPVLDQFYDLLNDSKQPQTFYELMNKLVGEKVSKEDRPDFYARVYTNLNLDGRFLSLGNNFWGLKSWYPIDQRDEEIASKLAPKRKRKSTDDDLDEDFDDLDEDIFDDEDLDDEIFDDEDLDDDFVADGEDADDDDFDEDLEEEFDDDEEEEE